MPKNNSSIRKRIFSLLLASVMTLSSTATAFAAEDITATEASVVESIDSSAAEDASDTYESLDAVITEAEDTAPEQSEVYHFVSDIEGEGMLPYEYYIIDCSDIETSETELDVSRVPSYYSAQTNYNSSFAYNALSDDEKVIYDTLYAFANTIDSSADYSAEYMSNYSGYFYSAMKYADSAADRDTLYRVYVALTNDNPQFFWMGHSYLSGTDSSGAAYFYFSVDSADYASGSDRMTTRAALYEEIESVVEGAAAYGNEYTKEWYIHNYLCDKTVYDLNATHAHDITGLLIDGAAVCESYAKCFQLFMNALEIDVLYVTGLGNGGAHAWNQVGLDNNGTTEWYNIDVTWDDTTNGYSFNYFNAVDSDGTVYDFTKGTTYNGSVVNAHVALSEGDDEYIYPVYTCSSTTYSYSNHSTNYTLASTDPVAKIGTTEYTSLDAAITASTAGQTITLLDNVTYNGATMPSHTLTIDCADYCIEFADCMDMNGDLTIKNLNGYTFDQIYANGYFSTYDYNYIYLNDNTLSFSGTMTNYLPALISGYDMSSETTGIVSVDLEDDNDCCLLYLTGVEGLTVCENEYVNIHGGFEAGDVVLNDNAVLSIDHGYGYLTSLAVGDNSWLSVTSIDEEPYFIISGDITGDVVNVAAANMEEGLASVVTRQKYPVELFNFVYITTDSETEYEVSRVCNVDNVYLYMPCATADYTISNGTASAQRCTFAEAIEYIEEQNDSTKDYTITFTGAEETVYIQDDITFTSKAKSITYSGNSLMLTGDVTLDTDIKFTTGGNFYCGSLDGNGHTITYNSCTNVSSFNGCSATDVYIVVNDSTVTFIDTESTGNDILLNSLTLSGDADIGFSAVNKMTIDELVMSGENNRISFNSGKAEIGNITSAGNSRFNVYSSNVITLTGSVTLPDSTPITIYSTSATSGQKIMTVSEDLSDYFTTNSQNDNGDTFSVVYRNNALVYDIPVFELEDVGIYSQWSDILEYINTNGSSTVKFTVTLLDDAAIDNFTLPQATKASAITFNGDHTLTVNNSTLNVPTNTGFNCTLNAENTAVAVAKGITLSVTDGVTKSLTGTTTSSLVCDAMSTGNINTFNAINAEELTASGTISAVSSFSGTLILTNSSSTASITKISNDSSISYMTGDTLPKVTVTSIANGATLTINANEGAALAGGTTVLYCSSDISENIVIENTSESGKALTPIYYASSKCIKAEDASAVMMFITDTNGSVSTRSFPSVELALAAVNNSSSDYRIVLNQPFEIANLTLPKAAKSITFEGEQLTLNNAKLTINSNTAFKCSLVAANAAVTVVKGKTLTLADAAIKSIKGTTTSDLYCSRLTVTDINTFNYVICDDYIDLNGKVAGVKNFAGKANALDAASTIAITNIVGYDGITNQISLYAANDKFAKLTVTAVAEDAELAVMICDSEGSATAIASGTTVMYSAGKDISERITVLNTTSESAPLKPYYYSKAIKAEWPDALTLSYNGESTNYPNLDKAFEVINANKSSTTDYTITLNTPVTTSKLTFPKYAGSITFAGSDLTFTGKTLKLTLNTYFDCKLIAESTALSTSKNLRLADASLKSLAGAKTSVLTVTGTVNAPTIKTFASIDASAGELVVSGATSGIASFNGNLTASTVKSNITITSAGVADIKLVANDLGTTGKLTINKAAEDAAIAIAVIDESGETASLPSGSLLFYSTADLSEYVTITNTTDSGDKLSAKLNAKKKAYYVEYAKAVEATYTYGNESVSTYYPSIEKAFSLIPTTAENITLTLNCDITTDTFTVPKFTDGLTINGASHFIKLQDLTAVSMAAPVTLNDVTINSTKAFKINTTSTLTLDGFTSSTLSAITGSSASTLCYIGENDIDYSVSGFGTLDLTNAPVLNISSAFSAVTVDADGEPTLNIKKGSAVKLTTINCNDKIVICYSDGATPVNISGLINGTVYITQDTSFTDGQQLATASKAEISAIEFDEDCLPDSRDYILTNKSGKICLKAIAFDVTDGTNSYCYADWTDFVSMVNTENNANATYTVTLTGDHKIGAALTMPKAGTYAQLIICSPDESDAYTLTFTGAIKQTGNLSLNNIILCAANAKGAVAAYTITTGKYSLTATNVDFGKITSVTGTAGSVITLDGCTLNGKLTAVDALLCNSKVTGAVKVTKTLTIDGSVEFGNTVNTYALASDNDCTIVLTKGKLLTIGKGGTGENTITISLGDSEITAKTKLGTVAKGWCNDNLTGDGFELIVEGTTINAYPI